MKPWEILLDIFLGCLVMVLFPVIYFGQKKDLAVQTAVEAQTKNFADEIREKGYLSEKKYDDYLSKMSALGIIPEIDIEQKHTALEPEYRLRTADEIINEDDTKYSGSNTYTYRPVTSKKPEVNDPINTGNLNTETNESILAHAVNTPADPNHVHTDACYAGHRHNGTCIPKGNTDGLVIAHWSRYNSEQLVVWLECAVCHKKIASFVYGYDGQITCIQIQADAYDQYGNIIQNNVQYYPSQDRLNGNAFFFNIIHLGDNMFYYLHDMAQTDYSGGYTYGTTVPFKWDFPLQYYTYTDSELHTYRWLGCLNCVNYGDYYSCGQVQDETPDCGQMIKSIIPTHPVQTVAVGDPLITTVTINFQDGSTKVVAASTDFSTQNLADNKTVTLSYTSAHKHDSSCVPQGKSVMVRLAFTPDSEYVRDPVTGIYQYVKTDTYKVYCASCGQRLYEASYKYIRDKDNQMVLSEIRHSYCKLNTDGSYKDVFSGGQQNYGYFPISNLSADVLDKVNRQIDFFNNLSILHPSLFLGSGPFVSSATMSSEPFTWTYSNENLFTIDDMYHIVENSFIGCPAELEYTSSVACTIGEKGFNNISDDGYTWELIYKCKTCGNTIASLIPYTNRYPDGTDYTWVINYNRTCDEFRFWQAYLDGNGKIAYRRNNIDKYLVSSVQKDSTWLKRDLKNGYYVWGKQNPEYYIYQGYWNDMYNNSNLGLISNFGYEPELGCPYCMKAGRVPKILPTLLSCGMDENFSQTKTCTIMVSVIPRTKTCPNGHTYNLNSDGSDPGCPYCKAWLSSLSVLEPSSGHLIMYRGKTLRDYGVSLLAIYMNGRQETITTGYLDNLDSSYIGNQTVTITYKGLYTSLLVTTKRNLMLCPVCGRYYELYPDDTDPGCPYCKAKTPIFTGKLMRYYSETYGGGIIDSLIDQGIYYFSRNDYIRIKVINKEEDWTDKLLKHIGIKNSLSSINYEYGGYIRDNGDPQ